MNTINITEFILADKKLNFDEAKANVPDGHRLPTKKELMLTYIMNNEANLPNSNVWSSDEYLLKNGTSNSAFAVQLSNGYTATVKKTEKLVTIFVKK
jgi:hypothetical protein